MKIPFIFTLLFAFLCSPTFSAFVAKQSTTVSGVTYSIGNNGNDCGVTRTENGATVSWYYTSGASNYCDCVGRNIFPFGSKIGVVLSINQNQDILTVGNSVSGSLGSYLKIAHVGGAIVFGYIDTSSSSGTFGKFTLALQDVAVDLDANKAAPIEYVSATLCDDKIRILLTVNVNSPYGMLNIPADVVHINGNRVQQIFNTDETSLTSYKANEAPFCTKEISTGGGGVEVEESSNEGNSGREVWVLALIIGLPCFGVLTTVALVVYIKTIAKKKASVKVEKFEKLPSFSISSPQVVELAV